MTKFDNDGAPAAAGAADLPVYTLTLTPAQARLVSRACEVYARLLRGQWHVVAEAVRDHLHGAPPAHTPLPAPPSPPLPETDREALRTREQLLQHDGDILRTMGRCQEEFVFSEHRRKASAPLRECSNVAFDLHEVIRHQLWQDTPGSSRATVDASKPGHWGHSQPLATIQRTAAAAAAAEGRAAGRLRAALRYVVGDVRAIVSRSELGLPPLRGAQTLEHAKATLYNLREMYPDLAAEILPDADGEAAK